VSHYGRDCQINRYANHCALPKAKKPVGVNTIEKYCMYCKKAEYKKDDCLSLNDGKEQIRKKGDKKKQVNTVAGQERAYHTAGAMTRHSAIAETRKKEDLRRR